MALPQDGQNANGLTKVTEIPTGKELIFIDPTTNEGGIITLEDLTTQILNKLTSKIFTLDQGNMTLLQALNQLNSKTRYLYFGTLDKKLEDLDFLSFSVPNGGGEAVNCVAWFGKDFISFTYISKEKQILVMQNPSVYRATMQDETSIEVRHKDGSNFSNNHHGFFLTRKR